MSTDDDRHHVADQHDAAGGRRRKLCLTEQSTALPGSCDQVLGEMPDDSIVQSVFLRLLPYGGYNIRKLLGHGNQSGDHLVRIEARFARELLPIA